MASSFRPLRLLYLRLNSELGKDEEQKIRTLLIGEIIPKRDLQNLKDPAEIFQNLEDKGLIGQNNLNFLKTLLEEIGRRPLVELVEECEENLKTYTGMPERKRPRLSGGHYADDGEASCVASLAPTHREMATATGDFGGNMASLQPHKETHSRLHQEEESMTEEVNLGSNEPSGRGVTDTKYGNLIRDQIPDVVYRCQRSLQETYQQWSHIKPFPWWDGTDRLKLEDIYSELTLQAKDGKKTKIAKADMFSPRGDCVTPRRILIEGDPGYGKSTFCKKLAFDWGSKESSYLNRFELLFLLELRDLYEYHLTNPDKQCLIDVISDLFLDFCDQDKSDLWNYIQQNQSEICIIFDGLDEVPVKQLPSYFQDIVDQKFRKLKKSVVVVTSRKIREKNEKQHYDTQLCIKGFDASTFKEFVKKHFNATHTNEVYGASFITESFLRKLDCLANEYVIGDLSKSPLIALMLCDISIEKETLPETITKLYTCIVDIAIKRYLAKGNFSEEETAGVKKDIINTLAKIAYSYRRTSIYELSDNYIADNEYVLKVGFLTKPSRPLSSGRPRYTFVHKTFLEYFIAQWFSSNTEELTEEMDSNYNYIPLTIMRFLAGILGNNVSELFYAIRYSLEYRDECFGRAETIDERGLYNDYNLSNTLLDLLNESCSDSTESIKACAATMPGTVKLNLDNIPEFNRGTNLVKDVIRRHIGRPLSDDTLILQIKEINGKTSKMFEGLSRSLAADDFKEIKQALFVNYTCFESQFDWLLSNLHQIRELQVLNTPHELTDIVSQVRKLHTHKLLDVVVLRFKDDYTNTCNVCVRKRDTDSTNESSDGIHVSLKSFNSRDGQSCTQIVASLKSMKSIPFDVIELKVRLDDVSDLQRDISNISECVQSVNAKVMSIHIRTIRTRFCPDIFDYLKFNIKSSLKPLHPSTEESIKDRKLHLSTKKYYKFEVRLPELKDLLPCIEYIATERLDLICADDNGFDDDNDDDDDDDERVNVKSKIFIDALHSFSRFKARQVSFSFPLFRFDLMETVSKFQRRNDSPSVEVTFYEHVAGHENWSYIKSQINVQFGKYTFHFTSNSDRVNIDSLNQALYDLVTPNKERVAIEILYEVDFENCRWNCGLMGMTLSMPSLDSQLIKKVFTIHNQLTGDVDKNVYDNLYDYPYHTFIYFYLAIIFARNACRKSRQGDIIKLIEEELAADTSFVQKIQLSRHEMCIICKCQNPIITQINENEDGIMLSCQFTDHDVSYPVDKFGGPFDVDCFIYNDDPENIKYIPLDERYSDLCRACENNPRTQCLCLTFSENDSAEKSLTEQIVNIANGLRYLRKLDIVNGDFTSRTDDDESWVKLLKKGSLTEIAFYNCNLHNKIGTLTVAIREIDKDRHGKLAVSLYDSLDTDSTVKFRDKLCESHFEISTVDNVCLKGDNISVNIEKRIDSMFP